MIDPRIPLALGDEVDQLRAEINEQARLLGISAEKELALRAENEKLKAELAAALAACKVKDDALSSFRTLRYTHAEANEMADSALAIKPDASALKAHDEALIERCAEVCDGFAQNETGFIAEDCATAIRALKEGL